MASLVENIRVSRFVIDGFSGAGVRRAFCGSAGGAAFPLLARLSTLGTAMPLTLTGKEFGELTVEDGCDAAGEGWAFSRISDSLGPLTEAMRMVGGGRTLGSSGKECAEEAAQAVRAMPVFLSNFGGQNCWCWGDCLAVGGRRFYEVWCECERIAVVGDFWGQGRAGRGQARTERAYEIRVLEQSPRREIEVSQQPSPVAGVEWSATEMEVDVDVDGLLVLLLVPLCTNAIWWGIYLLFTDRPWCVQQAKRRLAPEWLVRSKARYELSSCPDAGKSVSFMNPENTCESESEFPYHAISLIHR
jgi:hypothetical protein